METKSGRLQTAITGGSGLRRLAWASAALVVLCAALAGLDLRAERIRSIESGDAALREADEARIHALLARLRIELRSSGTWTGLEREGDDGSAVANATARQRDTLLRRAIEGSDDVRSVELVVAGPKGLVSASVGAEGGPRRARTARADADSNADEDARAKARWFSPVVRAAVEANGRRVARGRVEGASGASGDDATVEVVLAVHDAEDLVQGVLIATIELAPLATRLGGLASAETRFALVLPDGTLISPSLPAPRGAIVSLLGADGLIPGDAAEIVESEGLRSLLVPVSSRENDPVELAFWLERDAPIAYGHAAMGSPWPAALFALSLLTIALFAWDRDRATRNAAAGTVATPETPRRAPVDAHAIARTAAPKIESPGSATRPLETTSGEPEPLPVRHERFVLREWLADVRGCLEREAATRGLTLDLRCERALPRAIEQDPLWLGGLLVSLGREALDATRSTRVALEVTDEGGDRLRFEVDAGDTDLAPAVGMGVIAGRLGATLEGPRRGRIAVVVPSANAA